MWAFIYLILSEQVIIINYKILNSNWLSNLIVNLIKLTPYKIV